MIQAIAVGGMFISEKSQKTRIGGKLTREPSLSSTSAKEGGRWVFPGDIQEDGDAYFFEHPGFR